jgi:hypothetical protein
MREKLSEHIRVLFADAERRSPGNPRLAELKEELLLNTQEKYDHLIATGRTPEAAYLAAINGIGDMEELLNDVIGAERARGESESAAPAVPDAGCGEPEWGDDDVYDDEVYDGGEAEERGEGKRPPRSPWYKLVSGIIWTVVLCAYFAVSFATHAWSVTWLLFIMGIAADCVAEGIFDLRR